MSYALVRELTYQGILVGILLIWVVLRLLSLISNKDLAICAVALLPGTAIYLQIVREGFDSPYPQTFLPAAFGLGFFLPLSYFILRGLSLGSGFTSARDLARSLLDSEDFLSILRSSLPKGVNDSEHGLDFIPFMLHTIDERRRRFKRSARGFFLMTLGLGLIFSILLTYFAYILVNEEAAGPGRVLRELRSDNGSLAGYLSALRANALRDPDFQARAGDVLDDLSTRQAGTGIIDARSELYDKVRDKIAEATRTGDLEGLVATLKEAVGSTVAEKDYALKALKLENELTDFLGNRSSYLPRISQLSERIDKMLTRVEGSLEQPQNRTVELAKRLSLGIVVCTFFLVILRYSAGIYKSHHEEMLRAERDDLLVRRFYVGFKGSGDNNAAKAAILSQFVKGADLKESTAGGAPGLSGEEMSLLRELLQAVLKKV